MSDVRRFSMALAPYSDDYEMRPEPDGDYVRSEDYESLRSRLAEVEVRADKDVIERNRVIAEKSARLADLEAERELIVARAENAEAALAEAEAERDLARGSLANAIQACDGYRARLAEAEALLREIHDRPRHWREGAYDVRMYSGDYERIDAHLSRKKR